MVLYALQESWFGGLAQIQNQVSAWQGSPNHLIGPRYCSIPTSRKRRGPLKNHAKQHADILVEFSCLRGEIHKTSMQFPTQPSSQQVTLQWPLQYMPKSLDAFKKISGTAVVLQKRIWPHCVGRSKSEKWRITRVKDTVCRVLRPYLSHQVELPR